MHFVISRNELIDLLTRVQGIVPAKPTTPILSNVLLQASNDELILTTTDHSMGVRCYTDAKILKEGATTLPVKKLLQLARELTSVNIEIQTDENHLTEIKADGSVFKLRGKDTYEYPELPSLENSTPIQIPQRDLKELLQSTAFSVSREDNRYILTGVLMQLSQGMATFVGTDGKRLARAFTTLDLPETSYGSYTIPIKAVEEMIKILFDDAEEPAKIHLLEDRVALEANNTIIITKLLTGEYPDYNLLIPEKSEKIMTLHREELITLLRQILLFTAEGRRSVCFSFKNGELNLFANSNDIGEASVSMPVNYSGDNLEVAFMPSLFLDILRNCKNEAITFSCSDPYTPGVITDEGDSPLFVLMPMQIKEE